MPTQPYHRHPPFVPRLFIGTLLAAVGTPLFRTLDKLGRADRALNAMGASQRKRIAQRNPFHGYTPGKQDVFVAVYGKSGTNWTMQIAHQLIWHGQAEFDHIHCVVPWPDIKEMGPVMRHYAIPLEQATQWESAPERKRVIKTHFSWDNIPYSEEARYISVIRDPKDVFVSGYHFIKGVGFGAAMPSVEAWFKSFVYGTPPIWGTSWAMNAASFWAQRNRPNVLVLSFKSMKQDLRGTVLKIAEFLNIRASSNVIDAVCAKSSFEYMKSIDHKFRPWPMAPWRPQPVMIRKGARGGASEMLSLDQQREMDRHFIEQLKQLGSDLPYQEFADVAAPSAEAARAANVG